MIDKTKVENWKRGDTVKYIGASQSSYRFDLNPSDTFIVDNVQREGSRFWVYPRGIDGHGFPSKNFVFVK